jgi:HTH-type transcriptional regulator/antitoxin HigA
MNFVTPNVKAHWAALRPILTIRNDREYQRAITRMNALLDEIGGNERHPLSSLLDTLGALVREYEEKHFPLPDCGGVGALQYLMQEHGVNQNELPEIGSQGVVSEILRGKRQLNVRQINALAKRFKVSPAVFL